MRIALSGATVAALFLGAPALADTAPIRATYTGYVAGMPVLHLDAEFHFGSDGRYQVATRFRTAGVVAAFVRGEQVSRTEGALPAAAGAPLVPARYSMEGLWNGNTRRIALDYERGAPVVRALEPPNTDEREPVPPAQQAGTVDVLTALAGLTRSVARTGRCEGQAATFDGRRRTDFVATTVGPETLARERRSIFVGEAMLCRFEGRQVAGFHRTYDRTEAERPRQGRAWIARLVADAPPVPVRMEVESGVFGTAVIHLRSVERGGELIGVSRAVN
jgi:hypothetical protein